MTDLEALGWAIVVFVVYQILRAIVLAEHNSMIEWHKLRVRELDKWWAKRDEIWARIEAAQPNVPDELWEKFDKLLGEADDLRRS